MHVCGFNMASRWFVDKWGKGFIHKSTSNFQAWNLTWSWTTFAVYSIFKFPFIYKNIFGIEISLKQDKCTIEAKKRPFLSQAVRYKTGSERNTGKLKVRREFSSNSSQLFVKNPETLSVPGTRWLNARPLPFEEIWENSVSYDGVAGVCPSDNPAKTKETHFQMHKFVWKNLRYACVWKFLFRGNNFWAFLAKLRGPLRTGMARSFR